MGRGEDTTEQAKTAIDRSNGSRPLNGSHSLECRNGRSCSTLAVLEVLVVLVVMSLSQDGGRAAVFGQGFMLDKVTCAGMFKTGSVTSWGRQRLESDSGLFEQTMVVVIVRRTPL